MYLQVLGRRIDRWYFCYWRGLRVLLRCFQHGDPIAKAVRYLAAPRGLFEYPIEQVNGFFVSLSFKGQFECELECEFLSTALMVKTLLLHLLPARDQSGFAVGEGDSRLL